MKLEFQIIFGMAVSKAVHCVRELDRDVLEAFLKARKELRGRLGTPDLEQLNDDMIAKARLVLQWRNQVGEQTLSGDESAPMILRAMAALIEKGSERR